MNEDTPQKQRWPRSQRFQLSATGREASHAFKEVLEASRTEGGRASFDAAREAWAARLTLQPSDALYFAELEGKACTLDEMTKSLDGCGPRKQDVKDAIVRLVEVKLIELVQPPPPPPPAPPTRW
jgi:hypothetical protein